jgi:hypothetical protein
MIYTTFNGTNESNSIVTENSEKSAMENVFPFLWTMNGQTATH